MKKEFNENDLSYLTTHELWEILASFKIPYCEIEDCEKENQMTHEKIIVPKVIPRTDYEGMKSDILIGYGKLNHEQRRKFCQTWKSKVEKRKKELRDNE